MSKAPLGSAVNEVDAGRGNAARRQRNGADGDQGRSGGRDGRTGTGAGGPTSLQARGVRGERSAWNIGPFAPLQGQHGRETLPQASMAKLPRVDMLASRNWFCSARHEIARRNSLSTEDDRYKLPQLAVLVPPAVVAGVRRVLPIAPALTPDAQAHAGQRVATACRDLGAALLALVQALAARQPVACALDGVLDARVDLIVHGPVTSPAAGHVSPPSRGFQTTPDHDTPRASLWRQMVATRVVFVLGVLVSSKSVIRNQVNESGPD